MKKELRGGYTTGACMAAGVKAALLYRAGEYCERVSLTVSTAIFSGTKTASALWLMTQSG